MIFRIYDAIIDGHVADEIANDYGTTRDEAAAMWFRGVTEGERPEYNDTTTLPKYSQYVSHIDYTALELYYDYGADYYFAIERTNDYAFSA